MLKRYLFNLLKVLLVCLLVTTSFTYTIKAEDNNTENNQNNDQTGNDSNEIDPLTPLTPVGQYNATRNGLVISWDPSLLQEEYAGFGLAVKIIPIEEEPKTYGYSLGKDVTSYDLSSLINDQKTEGIYIVEIAPFNDNGGTGEKFSISFELYFVDIELHAIDSKGKELDESQSLASVKGAGPLVVGDSTTLSIEIIDDNFKFLYFEDESGHKIEQNNYQYEGTDENVTFKAYIQGDVEKTVNIDFGQGHEKMAKELYDKAIASHSEDVSIDGSVVSFIFRNNVILERLINRIEAYIYDDMEYDSEEDFPEDYQRQPVYDNDELFIGASIKQNSAFHSLIEYVFDKYSEEYNRVIDDNEIIYLNWLKPIDEIRFDLEKPSCGDEVVREMYSQTNAPDTTFNLLDNYHLMLMQELNPYLPIAEEIGVALWIDPTSIDPDNFNMNDAKLFEGEIEGDNDYYALIGISADFGYYFKNIKKANVNNEQFDIFKIQSAAITDLFAFTLVKIRAEHEFEIDKIAKNDIPGHEHSICDAEHKQIDRDFIYSLVESDKVFNKSNPKDLKFVYKRSVGDENTYSKFNVVAVDGKALESGEFEDYEGSLNMILKKDYLNKLSLGQHELFIEFTDGYIQTKFTVTQNAKPSDPSRPSLPKTGIE